MLKQRLRTLFGVPLIEPHDVTKWHARKPAGCFQLRLFEKVGDVADAEVGDRDDRVWNAQGFAQVLWMHDADPAQADIFRPRRQPQVLYRADRAIKIHLWLVRAAEYDGAGTVSVASHADAYRCIQNARQLE